MPPPRFSVRDLEQIITATGYKLVVTTDAPCHLFMRWTIKDPRIHKDPELKRGVIFPEKIRFCFVVYKDNEQEEPGDTYIHTFIKEPWPVCQTRYFYFWGTVTGEDSPSESPIFTKHRAYAPPPICPFERHIEASDNDCNMLWRLNAPAGWYWNTDSGFAVVGRYHPVSVWFGYCGGGFRFLNIPLTTACVVTSATFTVTASGSWPTTVVRSKIRGELDVNPLPFTTRDDYVARVRTATTVLWDNIPPFLAGQEYTSPDFANVINEIISLPGWFPGKPLVIFWDDRDGRSDTGYNCGRVVQTWDSDPNASMKLNIDCTP